MATQVRHLYDSFRPETYDLSLRLDPPDRRFSGVVKITGQKIGRPAKRLVFHQKNLKIKSARVSYRSKEGEIELKVARINLQTKLNEVRLHFDSLLTNGHYTIELDFTGQVNEQLHGVYASQFKDDGVTKQLICTQFESHHAREAFPCIDEPASKAVYTLTLDTPVNSKTVISNTETGDSQVKGDRQLTTFTPSPKMSVYLLAFIVGDLEYLEAKTASNILVRTYATADNVKHTQFALDVAVKTLDYYEDYFAVKYPLAKCDLIALPDFSSGAMENWGCITFREQAMLVDTANTSLNVKQFVANVVAHELTHQWFGNLVTMKWWDDLWLNESFASWMSYLAVDKLFPDWQVWNQFIVDEQGFALKQDSLEHTHPIEMKIKHPDEIRTIFDAISYEKGASVITMLHDYLGGDVFRDGIRKYLRDHSYANTQTVDLWRALESVSDKPVEAFMNHWTRKSGYPIVSTSLKNDDLTVEQHRFYVNPLAKKSDDIWPVPLFSKLDVKDQMFDRSKVTLKLSEPASFQLINQGRRGFYRTIYDEQLVKPLISDSFMTKVSDVDRLGLLGDAIEAAKAGYFKTTSVLELLEAYKAEQSVLVWEIIAGVLGSIRSVMDNDQLRDFMKPTTRSLVKAELERLGWQAKSSDTHFDKLLRPIIIGLAAVADEPTVLIEVKKLFYDVKPSAIDPDLRGIVYTTIARHGKASDFDILFKLYQATASSEEKIKLTAALTNFEQPELITRALAIIKTKDVRLQDVSYWISYSFANHYARDKAWQWTKDNWDWIAKYMGEDLSFYRLPLAIARSYSDLDFLKDFEAFFTKQLSPAMDRPYRQAVETIQWQADWRKRDFKEIKQYFAAHSKG